MLISLRTQRVNEKTSDPRTRAEVGGGESVPAGAIAHTSLPKLFVFCLHKR